MPLRPPRLQQVPKQAKLLRPRPLPQPRPAKHLLLRPRLSRARVTLVLPHLRPTIVNSRHSRARPLLLAHSLLLPLKPQKLPAVLRLLWLVKTLRQPLKPMLWPAKTRPRLHRQMLLTARLLRRRLRLPQLLRLAKLLQARLRQQTPRLQPPLKLAKLLQVRLQLLVPRLQLPPRPVKRQPARLLHQVLSTPLLLKLAKLLQARL